MSQPEIARFHPVSTPQQENNPNAADVARKRIADLPDPYLQHATPTREDLVGEVEPSSPAADAAKDHNAHRGSRLHISSTAGHHTPRVVKPAASTAVIPVPTPAPKPVETPKPVEEPSKPAASAAAPAHDAMPIPKTPKEEPVEPAAKEANSAKDGGDGDADTPTAKSAGGGDKPKRSLPSRLQPLITGVVTFVLLFLVFKAPIFFNQLTYLTSKPQTSSQSKSNQAEIPPNPVVSIPKINVNAPIVFANSNVEANIQHDLESGVVHYADTAMPGENGNSVIFGHSSNDWWEPGNYKFVFVLLDKLVVGDTYTVNYNSKQYMYQVVETKVVEPTDLSVLNQTSDPEMTLITCTPPGTSFKRLIVRAKQISPAPSEASAKPKSLLDGSGKLPGNSSDGSGASGTLHKWIQNFTSFFHGG